MATSGEIAQMMAAQNGQFVQQNAFAGQIGIANPAMSLGAYGGPGMMSGFQPLNPGMPGGHRMPGAWSYAPGTFGGGYGGGNAFAGSMMAGFGGAATLGMAGVGLAAGFGKMGPLNWLDPFNGFMGGFRAMGGWAGGGMGAVGMGMMGALPALGVGALASHAVGSVVHGAQQQSAISRELGAYQFANPASRTGQGFTRDDAKAIGDSIRSLAHVPEMMTSVEELTKLLPTLRKAGSFQGVKDVTEFQDRFKESIKTLKEVSKMLGTTMEEASQFFAHSRGVGFLGKQAQLQNAINAQVTSAATGMTNGEVMGLQQAGAAGFRAQGVSGRFGAMGATNWAKDFGHSQQMGLIRDGQLEDITGLQGADAVNAAAQRFNQAAFGMTRDTAVGNLLTYGLAKFDKNGVAIGIDAERFEKLKNGEIGYNDLRRYAGSLSATQKTSAVRYKEDIAADVAANGGAFALGGIMRGVMEDRFGDSARGTESAKLMVGRLSGLNAREVDVLWQTGSMDPMDQERIAKIRARDAALKEKYSPSAMLKRTGTRLHKALGFSWLEEQGAEMWTGAGKAYDELWDDALDREQVVTSKMGADAVNRAMVGDGALMRDLYSDTYSRKEMNQGFSERSRNMMTVGRVGKLAIGAAAGLGAGLLTMNPLIGGAAAYAAMGAMDSFGGTEGIDRAMVGGHSDEEIARRKGLAAFWGKGGEDWSKDGKEMLAGAHDVYRMLESRKWKNADGEMVTHLDLTNSERAAAARRGAFDRVNALGAGDYLHDAIIGGDKGAMAELDKLAAKSPELKRWVEAAKASMADAKKAGVQVKSVEELMAGAVSKMSRGKIADDAYGDLNATDEIFTAKVIGERKASSAKALSKMGIDSGMQSELQKNRKAMKLLAELSSNDKAMEAARNGDLETLKAMGIDVDQKDVDLAMRAYLTVDEDKRGQISSAVTDMRKAYASEQIQATKAGIRSRYQAINTAMSKATGLTDDQRAAGKTIAEALAKASEATTGEKGEAALKDARKGIQSLVSASMGLGEDGLKALDEQFGSEIGSKIREAVKRGKRKMGKRASTTYTKEEIAKQLGVSADDKIVDEIVKEGGGDLKNVNREEMVRIEGAIASWKTKLGVEGQGSGAHDKDNAVVTALKSIEQTSKLQTTLLAALVQERVGAEGLKNAYAAVYNEKGQPVLEGAKK